MEIFSKHGLTHLDTRLTSKKAAMLPLLFLFLFLSKVNGMDTVLNVGKNILKTSTGLERDTRPTLSDIEACVGCLFVWEKVRMNVGEAGSFNDVVELFDSICQDQPDVFYESCDDMFDVKGDITNDFLSGKSTKEMCELAGLCGNSADTLLDFDGKGKKDKLFSEYGTPTDLSALR
eukprot:g656.t1